MMEVAFCCATANGVFVNMRGAAGNNSRIAGSRAMNMLLLELDASCIRWFMSATEHHTAEIEEFVGPREDGS